MRLVAENELSGVVQNFTSNQDQLPIDNSYPKIVTKYVIGRMNLFHSEEAATRLTDAQRNKLIKDAPAIISTAQRAIEVYNASMKEQQSLLREIGLNPRLIRLKPLNGSRANNGTNP